jgi:hypothetical protein
MLYLKAHVRGLHPPTPDTGIGPIHPRIGLSEFEAVETGEDLDGAVAYG